MSPVFIAVFDKMCKKASLKEVLTGNKKELAMTLYYRLQRYKNDNCKLNRSLFLYTRNPTLSNAVEENRKTNRKSQQHCVAIHASHNGTLERIH